MDNLAGCSIFGEIDLEDMFTQFELDPESRPLTAFTWEYEQFMFTGCPFGIWLLPSFVQRHMSTITRDLPFTFAYLDNFPIASHSWSEHRDHLITLINRLTSCNLRIKGSAIKYGHATMKCLGSILTPDGIGADPKKVDSIVNWPLPSTGAELNLFLVCLLMFVIMFAMLLNLLVRWMLSRIIKKLNGMNY